MNRAAENPAEDVSTTGGRATGGSPADRGGRPTWFVLLNTVIPAAVLLSAVFFTGCGREKPLPVFGEIPAFQLTSQQGRTFERASLNGHVWIADFIYTHCEGPCPRMSSHMRAMQGKVSAQVKLVSFSVDPERDTPEALEAYGKQFGADDSHWTFLTGDPVVLNMLDHDAFKLGSLGVAMDHSTRFVLVDKQGRIRGYYGIADGDPVARIARDAERLEKEQA